MGFRQITELVQSALEQPFACELTGADGIDGFFCLVIEVRVRCGVYKGQDTVELVRFKDWRKGQAASVPAGWGCR